jgi:hypothetical protein
MQIPTTALNSNGQSNGRFLQWALDIPPHPKILTFFYDVADLPLSLKSGVGCMKWIRPRFCVLLRLEIGETTHILITFKLSTTLIPNITYNTFM